MKEYKLVVTGVTKEFDNVVKGFAEAEKRAFALYNKYKDDYPTASIACFEVNEIMYSQDYLCLQKDCFGDLFWRKMIVSDNCLPLYLNLLSVEEEEYLNDLRQERERHVNELSLEELKELRSQIYVGSMFLSDYENTFNIDKEEVMQYSDGYIEYLETEADETGVDDSDWLDTPEAFAEYCYYTE